MGNLSLNRVTVVLRQIAIFCDRWHWVLLALAAPLLLFPSPSRSLALFVVPGLWIVAWLAGREPLPRTPLNATLLLMFFMVLVSLWATYDIAISLPKVSGIVLGLGIFYAFGREGQSPRGWWLSFLLFLGIGFGIAAVGLLGTHWITKITLLTPIVSRLSPRITGLPGAEEGFHPNYVAGALLWVIPSFLTFSWLLLTRARDVRGLFGRGKTNVIIVLMIGATLWTIAIFILTQSRGGYIGLALTLPTLIVIALPPRWRWYSGAILALLAIILGVLLASHWEAVRIWVTGSNLAEDPALSLNSLEGRLEVWSRAIYGIQDFPFTGMGMNAFRKVVPVLYPLFSISPEVDIGHAHNEFLQAALDLGIPGLVSFLALYIGAFWMLVDLWRKGMQDGFLPYRVVILGLGGGLLAHMLWGLTDAMALGARPAFLFWVIMGLISGLHKQVQDDRLVVDGNVSPTGAENGLGK
jgi:putative inorganic carbon (HCO3(-)) transporter